MPSIGIADKATLDLVYGAVQNSGSGVKMQYTEEGTVTRDRVVQLLSNGKVANLPEWSYEDWIKKNINLNIIDAGLGFTLDSYKFVPLTDTKFLVLYAQRDAGTNYATKVQVIEFDALGEIKYGTALSLSTVNAGSVAIPDCINMVKIDSTRVLISYSQTTGSGQVRVISVSGLTATAGTASALGGVALQATSFVALDSTRYAFVYSDGANGGFCTIVIITVSGASIAVSGPTVVAGSATYGVHAVLIGPDKIAVGVAYSTQSLNIYAITIDGFTPTVGVGVAATNRYSTGAMGVVLRLAALGTDKFALINASISTAKVVCVVATVVDRTITAGTPYTSVPLSYAFGLLAVSNNRLAVTGGNGEMELLDVNGSTLSNYRYLAEGNLSDKNSNIWQLPNGEYCVMGPSGTRYGTATKLKASETRGIYREGFDIIESAGVASNTFYVNPEVKFVQFGDYLITGYTKSLNPYTPVVILAKYDNVSQSWVKIYSLDLTVPGGNAAGFGINRIDESRFLITFKSNTRLMYRIVSLVNEVLTQVATGEKWWSVSAYNIDVFNAEGTDLIVVQQRSDGAVDLMVLCVEPDNTISDKAVLLDSTIFQTASYKAVYMGFRNGSYEITCCAKASTTAVHVWTLYITKFGGTYTRSHKTLVISTSDVYVSFNKITSSSVMVSTEYTGQSIQYDIKIYPKALDLAPVTIKQTTLTSTVITSRRNARCEWVGKKAYYVTNMALQSAPSEAISATDPTRHPVPNMFVDMPVTRDTVYSNVNSFQYKGRIYRILIYTRGVCAIVVDTIPALSGTPAGYLQSDGTTVLEGEAIAANLSPGNSYSYDRTTGALLANSDPIIGVALSDTKIKINSNLLTT